MEEIINKIVQADNEAKKIISVVEQKKEDIDNIVEEEVKRKKEEKENEMRKIINEKKMDYEFALKEQEKIVFSRLNDKLKKIQDNFDEKKEQNLNDAYKKIIENT